MQRSGTWWRTQSCMTRSHGAWRRDTIRASTGICIRTLFLRVHWWHVSEYHLSIKDITVMYPMCIVKLSYIQKHHEQEPNNHTSEKTLVLLFLKLLEPRNKSIYKEFLSTFSLRAQSMALPFLLPTLAVILNQISLSLSSL